MERVDRVVTATATKSSKTGNRRQPIPGCKLVAEPWHVCEPLLRHLRWHTCDVFLAIRTRLLGDPRGVVWSSLQAALERECGQTIQVTCRFTHVYPDGVAP